MLHMIFLGVIIAAVQAAECSAENYYPDSFILTNSFFLGIYIMMYKLKSMDYLIEFTDEEHAAEKLFKA